MKACVEAAAGDPFLLKVAQEAVNGRKLKGTAPEDVRVALCMTTLGRNYQIKHSLPIMLMMAWPWRRQVRLYLADFNADNDLQEFICEFCHEAVQTRLLVYLRRSERREPHAKSRLSLSH